MKEKKREIKEFENEKLFLGIFLEINDINKFNKFLQFIFNVNRIINYS